MAKRTKPAGKRSGSEPKSESEDVQLEEMRSGGNETSESANVEISESVYRRVGQEVLAKNFDPLCWAKALAGSSGGPDGAVSEYARIRAEMLTNQVGTEVKKQKKLECRVARAYRDTNAVPTLGPINLPQRGGMGRALDAMFWHCVALVGAIGCLMATQILWPGLRVHLTVNRLILIVLAFQLFPVLGWVAAGRNGLYSAVNYAQAAHMSACVAIVASAGFGMYLLVGEHGEVAEFSPEKSPGSLLVVIPEYQLAKPIVHVEVPQPKPLQLVSTAGKEQ